MQVQRDNGAGIEGTMVLGTVQFGSLRPGGMRRQILHCGWWHRSSLKPQLDWCGCSRISTGSFLCTVLPYAWPDLAALLPHFFPGTKLLSQKKSALVFPEHAGATRVKAKQRQVRSLCDAHTATALSTMLRPSTHEHAHSCTRTRTCAHTHERTHTLSHTRTRTRTRTHAHAHTHAHTHTDTRSCARTRTRQRGRGARG